MLLAAMNVAILVLPIVEVYLIYREHSEYLKNNYSENRCSQWLKKVRHRISRLFGDKNAPPVPQARRTTLQRGSSFTAVSSSWLRHIRAANARSDSHNATGKAPRYRTIKVLLVV